VDVAIQIEPFQATVCPVLLKIPNPVPDHVLPLLVEYAKVLPPVLLYPTATKTLLLLLVKYMLDPLTVPFTVKDPVAPMPPDTTKAPDVAE
jgi:hypothetical protein